MSILSLSELQKINNLIILPTGAFTYVTSITLRDSIHNYICTDRRSVRIAPSGTINGNRVARKFRHVLQPVSHYYRCPIIPSSGTLLN